MLQSIDVMESQTELGPSTKTNSKWRWDDFSVTARGYEVGKCKLEFKAVLGLRETTRCPLPHLPALALENQEPPGNAVLSVPPRPPLILTDRPGPAPGGTLKQASHACSGEWPGPSPLIAGPLALPLHLPGSWIPGRGPWLWYLLLLPWVWQLITFPLQLFRPRFSRLPSAVFLPLVCVRPQPWVRTTLPLAWALRTLWLGQRWKWSSAVIVARGLRRPRSALGHSSSPSRERDAQKMVSKALTTISGDLEPNVKF